MIARLTLLALLSAPALAAQTPAERVTLDSIRARFHAYEDSLALIELERSRIAVARTDRDNPFIHMELGWLSYRLGELTGQRRRYQDAASEFQWAADLRPAWPYAWYHLGLAELATGEAGLILLENIRQIAGQDFLSQAVRSFARAVEADPTFSFALVELATTAMRQRVGPRLEIARGALRTASAGAAGNDPMVQLWRSRVERRTGVFDSALIAARRYVAVGGDSLVGGIEVARIQAQLGRVDSARLSYTGAMRHRMSDSGRVEVRRDLRWIAEPDELAEWDAAPADSAGLWVTRFWALRDARDGRRPGERLVEQLRRYQHAQTNYALLSRRRGHDAAFVYRDTSQSEFDDRGVVYMRHGEPTRRARYAAPGIEGNESWLYQRRPPEEDLVLHFAAINDVQDYRLVESLMRVCTVGYNPTDVRPMRGTARDTINLSGAFGCVVSRQPFGGIYDRLSRPGGQTAQAWASERTATRTASREAVTTDSYALTFANDLAPVVSYFAVADAAGQPELHLVFALPGSRLNPVPLDGGFAYPISLRMTVFDEAGRTYTLDTLRTFRSAQRLAAGMYVTEQLSMRVPPGALRYSFVVEELHAGTGSAVTGQPLEVPRLDGDFAASDVVLGRQGSGLVWRRPGGDVPLNPLMRFVRDSSAVIYYELYGLPQESNVATRVRILRRGGRSIVRRLFGGGGGVDLSYVTVTDAPRISRVRQNLELRGLPPGRYELELELTGPAGGEKLVRRTPFEIVER